MNKIKLLLLLLLVAACSNDNNNIVQRLAQEPAIVREVKGANNLFVLDLQNENNGLYSSYIVPSATLPFDYQKDGLPVIVSGVVTKDVVAVDGYISENKENTVTLNGQYNVVEITTMSEDVIIGKWKLLQVDIGFDNPTTFDYSQYNIIYEFKTNNVLTISGKTGDVEIYRGHEIGEHFYEIKMNASPPNIDIAIYWLIIDNFAYDYDFSPEELKLTYRNLESDYYLFEKNVYILIKIH